MNAAHLHLVFNHFPVIGIGIGTLLLIIATFAKNEGMKKAALWVFIISVLGGAVAFFSGEGAEEIVEHLPGVLASSIEPHEELAELTIIMAAILGVLSLVGLLKGRGEKAVPRLLSAIIFILAVVTTTLSGYTAYLGGLIHHQEVRPGFHAPHES